MCLNWRQMQAYILLSLNSSLMDLLEDVKAHSSPLQTFFPQSVRVEHSHFWPECASRRYWGTWRRGTRRRGTLPTLLSLRQGASPRWPRETGHHSKGLTQPQGGPENGKQGQGLCHILLLPVSDNCHHWKQQPEGSLPTATFCNQTPANQDKGILGPCNCSFRHYEKGRPRVKANRFQSVGVDWKELWHL